ncbi:t complex protein 10 [Holotrichia oblita]|uniref:T complex protein 10 n=1 Tax=Holotrichia oblita TaxID=644536 RepID=A0ACB9SHG4_HOLOL|nr:t complex protein 10 [Holotrichia oblita]
MSLTPSSLLARLEELKKWQEKQQERLSQQSSRFENTPSNYDTIQGLSQFDSSIEFSKSNLKQTSRPVLNEKDPNQESTTVEMQKPSVNMSLRQRDRIDRSSPNNDENNIVKPKRPFLKRGSGLVRFKMNPGDQKRPFNKVAGRKSHMKNSVTTSNPYNISVADQNIEFEVTPLKRPDINVKAVWFKVDDYDSVRGSTTVINDTEILAKKTISQINELAAQKLEIPSKSAQIHFNMINEEMKLPSNIEKNLFVPVEVAESRNSPQSELPNKIPSEQTLYERQLEKELLIFEALEEKAMNSSFCSTNSSILHILSSTPNKIKHLSSIKNINDDKNEKQPLMSTNIIEEIEDNKLTEVQSAPALQGKFPGCNELDKVNSLESSVTSEDFQEEFLEKVNFKDDVPWSDVNIYTRENSSLSSISAKSGKSSQAEDTLVSDIEHLENNVEKGETRRENDVEDGKEILAKKLKELNDEIQNFRKENAKLQKFKLELEKQERELKKEKKAFEKYVKEVHNKTTRKEREEIAALKEEVANLKEAAKLKETRNATSQARLRNQLKSFEKEIASLREELENLRKRNAKLLSTQQFSKKTTETKMLHEINKNLSKLAKDAKVNEKLKKVENSIEQKKVLINSLENDVDSVRKTLGKNDNDEFFYGQDRDNTKTKKNEQEISPNSHNNYETYLNRYEAMLDNHSSKEKHDNHEDDAKSDGSIERNYEMVFGENTTPKDTTNSVREVILANGSQEVTYPNGNIKTISPDGNFICMKYYNGDIKETKLLEGIIKYYYAENQSWQTTTADGTEIIEFSNGQVEKKLKDGTTEVKFPNGVLRVAKRDGSETISYPDKTRVEIGVDGEKIIHLPNGQKEIHNSEHMRREYPDGTVKTLYPDGVQETRYCNGRIRIKDKSGNLLLDSHANNT